MDSLQDELSEIAERLERETKIRDGARNMLRMSYCEGFRGGSEMRSQIQRELDASEDAVAALEQRRDDLTSAGQGAAAASAAGAPADAAVPSAPYLRPTAIRPVQGLEDLNKGQVHLATPLSDDDEHDEVVAPHVRALATPLVRVLGFALLGEPLPQDEERDAAPPSTTEVETLLYGLARVLQRYRALGDDDALDAEHTARILLQAAGAAAETRVRTAALHALRRAVHTPLAHALDAQYTRHVTLVVGCALARPQRLAAEREEALLVVRALAARAPRVPLADGIARALVAVAQETNDPLRSTAVETLAEYALVDAAHVARVAGFGALSAAVCEGPAHLATPLVRALLTQLDAPATRQLVHPVSGLGTVLGRLTEALVPPPGADAGEALATTAHVAVQLLSSWEGVFYLAMDRQRALRSLVEALRVQDKQARGIVLDVLWTVFVDAAGGENAAASSDAADAAGSRGGSDAADATTVRGGSDGSRGAAPDTSRQYRALVLVLLHDVGVFPALVDTIKHCDALRGRASAVLGALLRIVHDALPWHSARLHAFPRLLHDACNFDGHTAHEDQLSALTALASIRHIEEAPASRAAAPGVAATAPYKLGLLLDDSQFRTLLKDTNVPLTREHAAWNLDALTELLDGPLRSAPRLEEALHTTKLGHRLLSFYHPHARRYSALRNTRENARYTELACKLLRALVAHADGLHLLAEDRLLPELRECFEQVLQDPQNALFSPRNLRRTLAGGYFSMLAVLAASPRGLELLAEARFFSPLYAMVDREEAAPVLELALRALDYAEEAHPRVLLARSLAAGSEPLRLAATRWLGSLLWVRGAPQPWAVMLLLTQLCDAAPSVRQEAAKFLHRACTCPELLQCIIAQQPPLHLLDREDEPVFLRFLAQPDGFAYLEQAGLVHRALERWRTLHNAAYAKMAEELHRRPAAADTLPFPLHLYGELVKTPAGCAFLREQGDVQKFVQLVNQASAGSTPSTAELAGALWALGNLGASARGVRLLEEYGAVRSVTHLACTSAVISVRATCFYALGLLAGTEAGTASLERHGWLAARFVAVPRDRSAFLELPPLPRAPEARVPMLAAPEDAAEAHIESMLASLGNAVVASNAAHVLTRVRMVRPDVFCRIPLLARAVHLMDHAPLRLGARRCIWDLFREVRLTLANADELSAALDAAHEPPPPEAELAPSATAPRARARVPADEYLYVVPRMHAGAAASPAPAPRPALKRQPTHEGEPPAEHAQAPQQCAVRSAWPFRRTGFDA